MARKSVVERNSKRKLLVAKHFTKRQKLKQLICDQTQPFEARKKAAEELQRLPKDSNPVRVRNRCGLTGRPRGVYRKFGLARHMILSLVRKGEIPGVEKASW